MHELVDVGKSYRKAYIKNIGIYAASGSNMRKILMVCILSIVILASALEVTQTQASISDVYFLGYCYRGMDQYYGTYVTAYEQGGNGTVRLGVYNYGFMFPTGWYYLYETANISAVGINFDWMDTDEYVNSTDYGMTKTNPFTLEYYDYEYFMIDFSIPDTVSNLILHRYEIAVFNVNASGKEDIIWTYSGYYFAVYSEDQADAQLQFQELQYLLVGNPPYVPPMIDPADFRSTEAQLHLRKAWIEFFSGATRYMLGDFTTAKSHYQNASDLIDLAFDAESTRGVAIEDADLNSLNSQSNYYNALGQAAQTEADAAMVEANAVMRQSEATYLQSFAWILFGLGFVFMGFAAIVYGWKKPKPP
ncbi:MAG: hypothetical protein JSV51_04640 [Candidatus Bathyarchaeota archaeon]|nr:MAG: hypothetical protein JSV51_04640 [Candidatus Bathyarchaeota archaeon]